MYEFLTTRNKKQSIGSILVDKIAETRYLVIVAYFLASAFFSFAISIDRQDWPSMKI